MSTVLALLGFDPKRWRSPAIAAYGSAWFTVVAAAVVIAITRFGGALLDEPRAFVRMVLIPIWGWIGLAAAIWAAGLGLRFSRRAVGGLQQTIATVGLAHSAVLMFGFIVLVAGGLFEVLGPGFIAQIVVFGAWFPALLVASTAWSHAISVRLAAGVVVPLYGVWWLLVGDRTTDRIAHLL